MKTLLTLTAIFVATLLSAAPPETPAAATPAPTGELRLRFGSHDDETAPEKMSFEIHASDARLASVVLKQTALLKLGEMIPKTNLKLKSYKYKERRNAASGVMEEASELTIVNASTGKSIALVFNKPTDVTAIDAPGKPARK